MAVGALSILKKGLKKLQQRIESRRGKITKLLSQGKEVSESDSEWLDNAGNLVNEEQLLDTLEKASDYERKVAELDDEQKTIFQTLEDLGRNVQPTAGNKRKRPETVKNVPKQPPHPQQPVFTKKENATLAQRIEILDWHNKHGKNQSKTATHFNAIYPNLRIKQPLVSDWVKNEARWRADWEKSSGTGTSGSSRSAKRVRQTQHPEVTEMMDLWVAQAMAHKILLTGEVLRQKWTRFADLAGVPADERLNLSDGWLSRYKQRNGLKEFKRHGEAASADAQTVEKERQRIQELIKKYGYELRDIFNMDETGLFYALPPDRGLSDKQNSGVKGRKVRLTYAFTSNADGSEKLRPFIIGKARKPRAFKNKTGTQLGFYYRNNAKAWMTADLYQDWLREWDQALQVTDRKVLLLQDNFSGHIPPDNLQNIRVENFEPNLTAHMQPKDQGIIRTFKAHYRAKYIHRAIDRYDRGISPANIYDIDQLEAMRMADEAWKKVDTTTIRHCWRKAGILPPAEHRTQASHNPPAIPIHSLLQPRDSEPDPVAHADKQVESALDDLVHTGVLQQQNRMAIEALLCPADENLDMDATDEELCQAVKDSRNAQQNAPITGGDDDVDDDAEVLLEITRQEVLRAIAQITEYAGHMDDPLARKLDSVLSSFRRQLRLEATQNLSVTKITSYFSSST